MIATNYKFFLWFDDLVRYEVTPANDSIKWRRKRENGFLEKTMETALKFVKADFDLLWEMEQQNKCMFIRLQVEKICPCGAAENNDEFLDYWEGYLPLNDGDWDVRNCVFTVKPRPWNKLEKLKQFWTEEVDVYDEAAVITASTLLGTVEVKSGVYEETYYFGTWSPYKTVDAPASLGWFKGISLRMQPYLETIRATYEVYFREKYVSVTPPDGDEWISLGNDEYVRPIDYGNIRIEPDEPPGDTVRIGNQTIKSIQFGAQIEPGTLTDLHNQAIQYYMPPDAEVLPLETVIDKIFDPIEEYTGMQSTFFDINAVDPPLTNIAYNYAAEYLYKLHVGQCSNFTNQDEFATKVKLKPLEFLNDLARKYNIYYVWGDDGVLKVEHISHKLQSYGYSFKKKNYKYSRDPVEFPKEEVYSDSIETDSDDFDNAKIQYSQLCSNPDFRTNVVTYEQEGELSNITWLFNNADEIEDIDTLKKYAFVSLDANDVYIRKRLPISGKVDINGANAFSSIIENLHLHDKVHRFGTINGEEVQFATQRRNRKEQIKIKTDCAFYDEAYKFDDLIYTEFGLAEIDEDEYTDPGGELLIKCRS